MRHLEKSRFHVNGIREKYNRRMITEDDMKGRVDVLGLGKTHMLGQWVTEVDGGYKFVCGRA